MADNLIADKTLDVRGEVCPFPWVHAKKALKKLKTGQVLQIFGDHGPALKSIPCNFTNDGHSVLKAESTGEIEWEIFVRKEN